MLNINNSAIIYHVWNKLEHANLKLVIYNDDNAANNISELLITSSYDVSLVLNASIFKKRFRYITILYCINFTLVNFSNINNNIEYILFERLNIHYLELHYFKNLNKLTNLSIIFNNISVIQNCTFNDLHKLNHLNLTENNIEHIESRAFAGLYSLVVLDLNFNSILELDIHTFRITNNLGNSLTKTIQYIKLQGSKLQIIKSRSFIFDNMTSIDLSYNQINIIEKNGFDIKTISIINLKGNTLSMIDIHVFSSIIIIDILFLFDNDIKCDCELHWIKNHTEMLKQLNQQTNIDIQCGTIQLLEYIEYLNCPSAKGNIYIYIYIYIYISY